MYYFLVNPASKSNHGMLIWNKIEEYLQSENIEFEVYFSKRPGHMLELMRDICNEHIEDKDRINVVILGGDGTFNEAIQGVVSFDKVNTVLNIDLKGADMGVLIGKRGQTLDSLQYLVSLVINRDQEEYIHVKVDTENYRQRRKATLENLAKNIAYKVRKTRRNVSLEPMNPYERRIIHSALQNDRYVTTHSEGEEPYRRVVVTLKK